MEGPERGVVAFSKTDDPQLGKWRGALIPPAATAMCRTISRLTRRLEALCPVT
jgi:hypothetical protein